MVWQPKLLMGAVAKLILKYTPCNVWCPSQFPKGLLSWQREAGITQLHPERLPSPCSEADTHMHISYAPVPGGFCDAVGQAGGATPERNALPWPIESRPQDVDGAAKGFKPCANRKNNADSLCRSSHSNALFHWEKFRKDCSVIKEDRKQICQSPKGPHLTQWR